MAQVLEVGSSPTSRGSHIPEFQSWAGLLSEMTKGRVCSPPWCPSTEELDLGAGERQRFPVVTSAELIVVRLQQRLGYIPLLTAGQLLARALLWLATAAGAARQVGVGLREREGEARAWSV